MYKDSVQEYIKRNLKTSSTLKKMQQQIERSVIKLADDFKNEGQNAFDKMFNDLEEVLLKTRSFHLFNHFIICYMYLLDKEVLSNIRTFNLDKNYTFDTNKELLVDISYLDSRTKQFIIDNLDERLKENMPSELKEYTKNLMSLSILPASPFKHDANAFAIRFLKTHPLESYLNAAMNNKADEYFLDKHQEVQSCYEKWMLENSTVIQTTSSKKKLKI